jgi:hypothetical protein
VHVERDCAATQLVNKNPTEKLVDKDNRTCQSLHESSSAFTVVPS